MLATTHKPWSPALGLLILAACDPAAPPPNPSETRPAIQADAVALVNALDDAFNRDAPEDFAALHDPSWPRTLSSSHILPLLGQGRVLQQRSRVVEFRSLGQAGVALVECQHSAVAGPAPRSSQTAQQYLMFIATDAGPLARIRVAVEPGTLDHVSDRWTGVYSCPACNFRIGDDTLTNWLVAPSCTLSSGCVEMVAFYCADDDVRFVLSINPNHDQLDATALLTRLLESYQSAALRPEITPWQPPGYRGAVPAGLMGARCEFELDGRLTRLLLTTRHSASAQPQTAEICYLITIEGTPGAVARRSRDIRVLLDSFALADPSLGSQEIGARSAQAHSRGKLTADGHFVHAPSRVSCRKPPTWLAELRADAGLFGVAFACPLSDDGVTLTAYARPGLPSGVLLESLRDQLSQRLPADTEFAGDWQAPPSPNPDAIEASWSWRTPRGRAPRRQGTVVVYDDLYLVVDGRIDQRQSQQFYDDIVASISRR